MGARSVAVPLSPEPDLPCAGQVARIRAVRAQLLANTDRAIANALGKLVSESERVSVAVAFAKRSGLGEVAVLERGDRDLRFLAGTDFEQTELELLDRLGGVPRCETKVFLGAKLLGNGGRRVFHPKVYFGEDSAGGARALVGSANFTRGGLRENHEAAVLLEGTIAEEPLTHVRDYVAHLWTHPFSVHVTPEFRARYGDLRAAWDTAVGAVVEGTDYRAALEQYQRAIGNVVVRQDAAAGHPCWLLVSNPVNAEIVRRRGI